MDRIWHGMKKGSLLLGLLGAVGGGVLFMTLAMLTAPASLGLFTAALVGLVGGGIKGGLSGLALGAVGGGIYSGFIAPKEKATEAPEAPPRMESVSSPNLDPVPGVDVPYKSWAQTLTESRSQKQPARSI